MRRRGKYGAIPTTIDGCRFASKAEAARYVILRSLQRGGHITDLVLHPRYPIHVGSVKVCVYEADFRYTRKDGTEVVEDVKGVVTPVFRLKKKLMAAVHGIDVIEITAGRR